MWMEYWARVRKARRTPGILLLLLSLAFLVTCGSEVSGPSGSGWNLELVASGPRVGIESDLQVLPDGAVHILYHDSQQHSLHHATRSSSGTWQSEQLDIPGWVGHGIQVEQDQNQNLHTIYQERFTKGVRYARFDGNAWEYQYIQPSLADGSQYSVTLQSDVVHMVELSRDSERFRYWTRAGGAWSQVSAGSCPYDPRPTIQLIVKQDEIIVSSVVIAMVIEYFDEPPYGSFKRPAGYKILVHSSADNGLSWKLTAAVVDSPVGGGIERIPRVTPVSHCTAYDANDDLHIVYRTEKGILTDDRTGVIAENVKNSYLSMQNGPDGGLWLLFQKGSDLVLTHWQPGQNWTEQTRIINASPSGQWGLTLDSDRIVHVSFYNSAQQSCWYATWSSP